MAKGAQKCIVKIQNKDEEDIFVPPNTFSQSFQEIGVATGSKVTLIEMKNFTGFNDDEGGEGGEDENEEMDPEEVAAEQSEENPDEPPEYEKVEEPEQDQKASDVLFRNDDVAKEPAPEQP